MVRDGYFYALGLIVAAILVGWFTQPGWAIAPAIAGTIFLVVFS